MARGPLRIARDGQLPRIKRPGPGTLDFALRSIRGGKRRVMDELAPLAIEFEPRLERSITRWSQLTPWQRRFTTLDDLAAHADLTRGEFLGAIVRVSFEASDGVTDLLVACAFPGVVAASVKRARTSKGIADRQLLFEHMRALRAAGTDDDVRPTNRKSNADKMSSDALAFLGTDPTDNGVTH